MGADGFIDPIFEDRLRGLGAWLATNGEGIYATTPWRVQNETAASVWYTTSPSTGAVYAALLAWPPTGELALGAPKAAANATATLLGWGGSPLAWQAGAGGMRISMPALLPGSPLAITTAWVVKLVGIN